MTENRFKIAELDKARLQKVRELEETLGTYVVALEPKLPLAALSDVQLEQLQAAEAELGVVLVAYERT
jgi:hypothetical protein